MELLLVVFILQNKFKIKTMALAFSQGYMRGDGDPNLDNQIKDGGNSIPKLYIDDLTDSFYQFNDDFLSGEKWVLLFSGFTTKVTNLKVLLQGPATGSLMTTTLATSSLLPLVEPYESLGYLRVGFSGETVASSSVFTTNSITDWVLVELRDKDNPEIIRYNRAGLLKDNGEIYDIDGVTKLTFENIRDSEYYIAIKHRNHIGLMTKTAIDISNTIDFTTSSTLVFGVDNRKDNSGLLRLRAGKTSKLGYAGWLGISGFRANILKALSYNENSVILSVYSIYDMNLNGNVSYNGGSNDRSGTFAKSFENNENYLLFEQIPPILTIDLGNLEQNATGQQIQKGDTTQRTGAPSAGIQRYNTTDNKMEYYNGTTWIQF